MIPQHSSLRDDEEVTDMTRFHRRALFGAVLAAAALLLPPGHAGLGAQAGSAVRATGTGAAAPGQAAPAPAALAPEAEAIKGLKWRAIGPTNNAGRVSEIVGVPGDPSTFYVGGAAGGLFKTTNGGVTWKAIFDDQPNVSIGAVAIAPSDPNVLYVGTGEGNPRNSASFGEGMFKSVDGGDHWTRIGLEDTGKIARVVVDPKNPDVVYVAALGHTWGPSEQRGLFKTTDGGRTWTKILYKNDLTGCSDVAIDPTNANIVYAGMYTHRRWAWYFESGGGETAVYKSVDGGATWTRLSGPENTRGLPKGPMDRIGIAVARSNPGIVYVISETKDEGMLWRSEDAGATWRTVNRDPNINFRPFYYSDIRVDPVDPNTVYSLSGSLLKSEDGGRTFQRIANSVHGDHQALWIDPLNRNRILNGSDGGFHVSYDGGKTWDVLNNIAFTQFYHVNYDMQTPYHVCGGLQDNGTWCGPSQSLNGEGMRKIDWFTVGGGDGFWAVPDLARPHLVYNNLQGGVISLTDTRTGLSWPINPYPAGIGSSGQWMAPQKYRFNWNAPIALSPQDPQTVYYGGNVLFKTTNFGRSWEVISPDLTTNDKEKQKSSGGPIVTDNTAAEFHCTIISIAPSPVDPNVIWVGTDDGNVQVTRDGGKTWTNTAGNLKGIAPNAWISTVEASPHDAATAFVAASHWQTNADYAPYFFKTTDFGRTWTKITNGMRPRGWSHVIRQDPKNPNVLYAGTENDVYASWDGGSRWVSIRNGLPPVPVRDLLIHPREHDVILATHGRGMFILDDARPIAQLAEAMKQDAYLFDIRPAIRWVYFNRDGNLGDREWTVDNPEMGAYINLYLKQTPKDPLTITIADKAGRTVRTLRNVKAEAGITRVVWDLRHDNPVPPPRPRPGQQNPFADIPPQIARRFGFGSFGPAVLPGEYTVKVAVGGRELSKTVTVTLDPRVEVSEAELTEQLEAAFTMLRMAGRVNQIIERTNDLIDQLQGLHDQLTSAAPRPTTPTAAGAGHDGGAAETQAAAGGSTLAADVKAAIDSLKKWRDEDLARPLPGLGYRQYPRLRDEVQSLAASVQRGFRAPNAGERLRMKELADLTDQAAARLNAFLAGEVARINQAMSGRPRIFVEAVK
jgi:photosystem II stability/assembly factor-like uncharacterized protein